MNDKLKNNATEQETINKNRRKLFKHGAVAVGGTAAFAAGYAETAKKAYIGLTSGSSGESPKHAVRGNSLTPEFMIDPDTKELTQQAGQVVSPSSCLGCWTQCGVRVRVDQENNEILRISGNPYHPLATTYAATMSTSVRDVFTKLGFEGGYGGRATTCARGTSMQGQVTSPFRVLGPLKRVGKRGSGEWQRISFEQLIEEICEGGDLFGEGHVDGLRAIYDRETPVDSENPEYGPISNQLLVTDSANEGRTALLRRFAQQSFGTINWGNHGSYCGQSFRVGTGMALGNVKSMPHGKPDWKDAHFGLFIGAAPAQSGNPFQRQGRELAEARSRADNPFKYVVVSPILPTSSSLAAGSGNRWLAVNPATDLALVMALIRRIIEKESYNKKYLEQPGPAAMKVANEATHSNATHLLINDPEHPRYGTFVRGADLGWALAEAEEGSDAKAEDVFVVQLADGTLAPHTVAQAAELMVEMDVVLPGVGDQAIKLCSALSKLRDEAQKMSYEEYSEICGISVKDITDLADEFSSFGNRAVADAHGGTMNGAGFYTAYGIAMLNNLMGNINMKGGLALDAGPFGPFGPGPRYDFRFKGQAGPKGVALSRNNRAYESTSEYKRKVAAGENPYPAKAPWYPLPAGSLTSEMLASGINGYPYNVKVWLNHMSNPMYALNGFANTLKDDILDPKKLPLIIAVNPFINETAAISDYIVPDTVTYESWGIGAPWSDVVVRSSTIRTPILEPRTEKNADGEVVCLETFLIAAAKRLGMPGFGENAIGEPNSDIRYPLNTASDFYLRGMCNIAYAQGRPVGDASDDDLMLTGMDKYTELIRNTVKEEEWRKVAMVITRGGRFDDVEDAWNEDQTQLKIQHKATITVWDESLYKTRHSMTGENNSGCPTYYPTRLADGSSMRDVFSSDEYPMLITSYKSNLMSSMSIGVDRLRQVHPHNPISINKEDAAAMGIRNGDTVRVVSPGGSIQGVALVRDGIQQNAIAIEHGYGHWELGVREHSINGKKTGKNEELSAGVLINQLGFSDPTRGEQKNIWVDWGSGAAVRQGMPVRLEKVAA